MIDDPWQLGWIVIREWQFLPKIPIYWRYHDASCIRSRFDGRSDGHP